MHNLPYNGRKPPLWSDAMKQVSRFAVVFVAALSLCATAFADPYRVKDLVVDKVAPSAPQAAQQGRDEARLVGAARLIERLTLPEDRAAARSPIDTSAVSRLFRSYEVQEALKSTSASGGVRSTGVVIWNFKADAVREYLDQRGVPYVDTQSALALIVPSTTGGDASAWGAQWAGKSDNTVLTPYVAASQAWPRRPNATEVQSEVQSVRADHGIVAELTQQGAQYYVRLIDLRPNVPKPEIAMAGPFVSLASAQTGAVAELERAWKVASIVRSTGSTGLSLVATFRDLQEWVKIKKSLEGSRLVSNLNIEALTTLGADISFTYAGRQDQLVSDLRSRGVDLANAGGNWQLRVVAAP